MRNVLLSLAALLALASYVAVRPPRLRASPWLAFCIAVACAVPARGAEPRELWGPTVSGGTAGFGFSMHASGDLLVIGAPHDEEQGADAGAVYVYRRQADSTWAMEGKLTADDSGAGHQFGFSVASSGDRLLVGAPYVGEPWISAGAAYVFRHVSGSWTQESKLDTPPHSAQFGWSVGISGNWAGVSSIGGNGVAHVFRREASGWTKVQELQVEEWRDWPAGQVSVDSDLAVTTSMACAIGPCGSGNVYRQSIDGYIFETQLWAPDGALVDSVAASGDVVVLGASGYTPGIGPPPAGAYVFRHRDGAWQFEAKLLAFDMGGSWDETNHFGGGVAVAGDLIVVKNPSEYSTAYTFRWDGVSWRPEGILTGWAGGIRGPGVVATGNDAILGGPLAEGGRGAAYLFGGGCTNAIDDDGDGLSDAADPGCEVLDDLTEDSPFLVCDDGVDNDGDGLSDFPTDGGCADVTDPDERSDRQCDNGLDDDRDGLIDFPTDGGCADVTDPDERSDRQCDNGLDDDNDGLIDWRSDRSGDPHCVSVTDNSEAPAPAPPSGGCGLGPELALLLAPLAWRLRRREAALHHE